MTLKLTLTVQIEPNGVSERELAGNLEYVVTHAMGAGLITADTEAEVNHYEYEVNRLDQQSEGQ